MAAQTVVWNKSEKSDIVVSAANIKAIKDAITAAKLASSTATANDGDKVKFSGIASGDTASLLTSLFCFFGEKHRPERPDALLSLYHERMAKETVFLK